MVFSVVTTDLLINEIKLGDTLSKCVHQARRSDFSLLLAMLTDDAREFSEFLLPEASQPETTEASDALRRFYQLPEPQALGLEELADIEHYNESGLVHDDKMVSLQLKHALAPKALAFRDNKKHVPQNVLSNMNVHSQRRYQQTAQDNNQTLPAKLHVDAKKWLSNIEQSLLVSKLQNVHNIA